MFLVFNFNSIQFFENIIKNQEFITFMNLAELPVAHLKEISILEVIYASFRFIVVYLSLFYHFPVQT